MSRLVELVVLIGVELAVVNLVYVGEQVIETWQDVFSLLVYVHGGVLLLNIGVLVLGVLLLLHCWDVV